MQANGLVERYNQTIQNMIRKFIGEKKESWDIFLDTCTFAYNTSLQKSTNYTPFEVMFGQQAILPVDFDDGKHQNATAVLERLEKDDGIKYKETAEVLMSHRKNVLERVKSNIIKAQKKQKEEYDKKHAKI